VAGPRLGRDHRAFSEINVTPLVDVMLVLLIIFMVTAPMLQQGLEVNLPKTTTQPLRMSEEPLVLSVKKDGSVYLANTQIPTDQLQEKLQAIFQGQPDKEVYLRADKDAPYGLVVKAMATAREAGARRLGVVTEPE
jgi:biopolymer transport protein TolR